MRDMQTPDAREDKLPKWAQDELRVLRMRLREATEEVQAYALGSDEVLIDPYSEHALPVGDRDVSFKVYDRYDDMAYIKAKRDKGGLELYGTSMLRIDLHGSNIVPLELRPR